MEPLVSIIIPTYNSADFLKLTIKSILNQTHKNIEVIVVDDGSTDNTSKVVKSFNDPRIKYIYQERTGTPAAGRNTGLRKCKGEYIGFLDHDDLLCPEKLKVQIEYFNKYPEYYLIYSSCWRIDENGMKKGLLIKSEKFKEGRIFKDLVKENFIPLPTVLIKREVFENIGFFNEDLSMKAVADYDYWLRTALKYKIGFIDKPFAMYRVHPGGMSNNINYSLAQQRALSLFLNNPQVPQKYKKEIKNNIRELYFGRAIYTWRNPVKKLETQKMLREYLKYSIPNFRLLDTIKALVLYISLKVNVMYYLLLKIRSNAN